MLDILGKRYFFFALSLVIIIPGLIVMAIYGLPLAIDFTGGTLLEVRLGTNSTTQPSDIVAFMNSEGLSDVQVTTTSQGTFVIRSTFVDDNRRAELIKGMTTTFNQPVEVVRVESVGPTIGQEVAGRAALAVVVAAIAVIIYITFAFRGIPHAFRYGVCAIIAMIHDVLVVMSLSALGGHFLGWQVDSLFLTALLTVIGFSTQDKIVVFDRIRENTNIYRKLPFEKLVNHSIIQTLQRSINTQLMTVEFMLLSMALFGGITLREFAVILLVGLFSGTYSSIFIAAPILVLWEKKEWRTWFKRKNPVEA